MSDDPFAGIGVRTPRDVANRPGLAALRRRIGARPDFLASMLASFDGRLHGVRTDDRADPSIALFDAAAVMLDIVTRYTEATAQEQYLETATERGALVGLAGLTGARLGAGRASEAQLCFTVAAAVAGAGPGEAPAEVTIPAGTRVQSVPLPGEKPVTYRTAADLVARGERNAVRLARFGRATNFAAAPTYRLATLPPDLKPGTMVAIESRVAMVASVEPDGRGGGKISLDPATAVTPGWPTRALVAFTPPAGAVTQSMVSTLLGARVRQEEVEHAGGDRRWDMSALAAALNAGAEAGDAAAGIAIVVLGTGAALFGHNGPDVITRSASGTLATSTGVTTASTIADQSAGAKAFDLDGVVAGARRGARILLRDGGATVFGTIDAAVQRSASGFNLHQRVTRVTLAGSATGLNTLTLLGTEVLVQSARTISGPPELPAILDPADARLVLDAAYFGIAAGAPLIVTGRRADGDGGPVAIARTIADIELDGGRTVLVLDGALGMPLQRETVRVALNTVRAIQGELVSEVLGSGDAARSWQRFQLKQGPLSWVASSGPVPVMPDIEVRVGGIRWDRRDTFLGAGPDDRIWVLETAMDGQGVVAFGDGVTGARLPTGVENVTARYGKGIGKGGNVLAGQLTLPLDRPAGLSGVTNPLPGGGGADPEQVAEARRLLPAHIRAMGRAVTLSDYADLALGIAGVAEARADWLWDGKRRVAAVTAAGADGVPLDAQTFACVAGALAAAGEDGVAVTLLHHRPRSFAVIARLAIDPAFAAAAVLDAAAAALSARFGFGARWFAQPVYPSEVVALLQGVAGVRDVDLDALWALDGAAPAAGSQPEPLGAAGALRTGSGELRGAELLLIEPNPRQRLSPR